MRGTKLQVEVKLIDSANGVEAVKNKSRADASHKVTAERARTESVFGNLKIRRETKGRAGKAVSRLFEFSCHPSELALKNFSQQLKNTLACGGTHDHESVTLQCDDIKRVETLLVKLGLVPKLAGGG